jgi:hypothetical protein
MERTFSAIESINRRFAQGIKFWHQELGVGTITGLDISLCAFFSINMNRACVG